MPPDPSNHPNSPKAPFILWRPFVAAWRWLAPSTQASRDRQSHTSRFVGITIVITASVLLCTLAILYARPLYNAWQDWRANQLIADARSLVDEGELLPAIMAAQEAYTLSPENIAAIRLNAEFFTRMKKNEALNYSERPIYMPDVYQVSDRKRNVGPKPSRADCNLPPEGFVFCTFNYNYKYTSF